MTELRECKPVVFPEVDVTGPHAWAAAWALTRRRWLDAVAGYEAAPGDFCNAWHYLDRHPVFWVFCPAPEGLPRNHRGRLRHWGGVARCVRVAAVKADPATGWIELDPARDTATWVWMEASPASMPGPGGGSHDWDLDTQAPTYELAVVGLARAVWGMYGNDRTRMTDGDPA
jgi:hypothetical protein